MNIHEDSWIEVEKFSKDELTKYCEQLESKRADSLTTQYLRGKIAALRKILALPDVKEIEKLEIEDYK